MQRYREPTTKPHIKRRGELWECSGLQPCDNPARLATAISDTPEGAFKLWSKMALDTRKRFWHARMNV